MISNEHSVKTLVPVYPRPGLEQRLLHPDFAGGSVLKEVICLIAQSPAGVLLLSDQPHVIRDATRAGLQAIETRSPVCVPDPEDGIDALPRDTGFTIKTALGANWIRSDDTVMLVDYRGPGLPGEVRMDASRRWREGGFPLLVSVNTPLNHPVQCLARVVKTPCACAVLAFFDADGMSFHCGSAVRRITRPFPLGILDSIFPEGWTADQHSDGYAVEKRQARRIVTLRAADWPKGRLPAAVAIAGPIESQAICLRGPDGTLDLLWREGQSCADASTVVYSCHPDGVLRRLEAPDPMHGPGVRIGGSAYGRFGRLPEIGDAWGILALRMVPLPANDATTVSPLMLAGGGWHVDGSGRCLNDTTGMEIVGRQDFPDVQEADGAIAVFNARNATRAAVLLATGRGLGFVCPPAAPSLRGLTRLARLAPPPLLAQEAAMPVDSVPAASPEGLDGNALMDEMLAFDVLQSLSESNPESDGHASHLADIKAYLSRQIQVKRHRLAAQLAANRGDGLSEAHARVLSGILDPDKPEFWKVVRKAYLAGRVGAVIALLDETLSHRPKRAMLYLQRGMMHGWQGHPRRALRDFAMARRYSQRKPIIYLPLQEGAMLNVLGRSGHAERRHLSLLRSMPDNLLVHLYLGVARFAGGRDAEAIAQLDALANGPGGLAGMTRHLDLFTICQAHAFATIWMIERHAWGADPACIEANWRAVTFPNACLAAAGGWSIQMSPAQGALGFLRGAANPTLARAIQARSRGEMGRALLLCRQAEAEGNTSWLMRRQFGLTLNALGHFESALEYFRMDGAQDNPWNRYAAMAFLFKQGRYSDLFDPSLTPGDPQARLAGEVLRAAAAFEEQGLDRAWNLLEGALMRCTAGGQGSEMSSRSKLRTMASGPVL